jgi:uncharacterized protein
MITQNTYWAFVNTIAHSLQTSIDLLKNIKTQIIEKGLDENVVVNSKLAPDMFPLVKQVQILSDNGKSIVSNLSGKPKLSIEDNESTMDELIARLEKTLSFVKEFNEEDFVNANTQKITFAYMPGKYFTAENYITQFAIPNFYFHKTTIYNILRNQGFEIGKKDFIGNAQLNDL